MGYLPSDEELEYDLSMKHRRKRSGKKKFAIGITTSNWFTNKLSEPQLPLYVVTSNINFSAIAFGIVKADEQKFKGIAKFKNLLPNVQSFTDSKLENITKWEEQIQIWKTNLEKIAYDFFSGNALIDPKNPNISCRYCDLRALCRV